MDKIKIFYQKNMSISLIGIGCLIIALLNAIISYFSDQFISTPWLSMLDGLALSYIAALVFYIFQVYIPEKSKAEKAILANENQFEKVVELIDVFCLVWEKYTLFENDRVRVMWNGTKTEDKDTLFFVYHIDGKKARDVIESYSKRDLMDLGMVFRNYVIEIKQSAYFGCFDEETLSIVSEMEKCNLFESIRSVLDLMDSPISVTNPDDAIKSIKMLSNRIKEKINLDLEYSVRDPQPQEIVVGRTKRDKSIYKGKDYLNDEIRKEEIREFAKAKGIKIDETMIESIINSFKQ